MEGAVSHLNAQYRVGGAKPSSCGTVTEDERQSARLLFEAELAHQLVAEEELIRPEVQSAVRPRRFPPRPLGMAEALAVKGKRDAYESWVLEPQMAARRTVLGDRAPAAPRFLVRLDEFPEADVEDRNGQGSEDDFRRFHEIMAGAGVPYLLAVLPRPSEHYLDPDAAGDRPLTAGERELLARACAQGAEPAVHGLTHRTWSSSPQRHCELCGLSAEGLADLLDRADAELAEAGLQPWAFVPPFNRFRAWQYRQLAERFAVICGGPESVRMLGFQGIPLVRDGAVYMPSYPPFYGTAGEILPAARRAIELRPGTWIPITLHLGWEAARGWTDLERLARLVAPYTRPWSALLGALDRPVTAAAGRGARTAPAAPPPGMTPHGPGALPRGADRAGS